MKCPGCGRTGRFKGRADERTCSRCGTFTISRSASGRVVKQLRK